MSDVDSPLAASIGAAFAGAVLGVRELFRRKPTDPAALDARIAAVEAELRAMKQSMESRLERVSEAVEELCIARARTDELLPIIRDQIKELREDIRARRKE